MKKFDTKTDLILFFLIGCKRYFILGSIFTALLAVLDLVNPKVIGYTVDSVIGEETTYVSGWLNQIIMQIGGREYLRSHIYMVACFVIAVALLAGLCRYLYQLFNSMGAEQLVKRMRTNLYEQIEHLPFAWHGEHQTGDIIQRCTSDVETIKRFLSEQLTTLLRIVIMIVLSVYFMMGIHVKLTLIAISSIPIVVLYSFFFHSRLGNAFEHVDEEEGRLSSIAQENLTGVRVVRAFGRELYERERFEKKNEEYTHLWIHMMNLLSQFWAANDFISGFQVILVVVFGAVFCVQDTLTPGQYISFISYNTMLVWPVRMLGRVISEMSKAGISVGRIQYIMNAEREEMKDEVVQGDYKGDICFEHVSFTYEGSPKPVLEDISFTLKGGSTIGILGGTGSGKSTLIYLLDRLYDLPEDKGRITIGGVPVSSLSRKELRKHIGLVLQEPYLFSRTLEENIMIGTEMADHKDMLDASKSACLDHAVEQFTEGYQTFVGERGVTLSGGQKQRTAIAQTLIRKPEILIFDDSLSAVDAETDAKIRKGLEEHISDATVILISHRLTTLMQADVILVLEDGKLIESGNHEELMKQDGMYRRIYNLQMQQNEGWEDKQ